MLGRELAIVLRAPVTWLTAAASALLIGHGFVLAVDLYSSGSRSVAGNLLMARDFDPLLGIVRPTLGGLNLALSLFGPLMGARALAVDKDRRTFVGVLLSSGSLVRFVTGKWIASLAGAMLPVSACCVCLTVWCGMGGHLSVGETIVAVMSQVLYAGLACGVGIAAAAFTESFSQAATAAIACIAAAWAVDAAEGFSALAWLGGAAAWSPSTYLAPFEQGTLQLDCVSWYVSATVGLGALACVGCRFDVHGPVKWLLTLGAAVVLIGVCMLARQAPGAWDLSEARRHSLPPTAATALARLPGRLRMTVNLDREDSRRRQLETDSLSKLRLARPDLELRFPPDDEPRSLGAAAADDYGTITLQLGSRSTQTTSTSRRELTTRIFELAGRALPDWSQPEYRGYPLVTAAGRRSVLLAMSYGVTPLAFLIIGLLLTRARGRV